MLIFLALVTEVHAQMNENLQIALTVFVVIVMALIIILIVRDCIKDPGDDLCPCLSCSCEDSCCPLHRGDSHKKRTYQGEFLHHRIDFMN
jgi:hypothetical protein